ncbi:MAG: hypothetical protein QM784_17670 [Polyangiaceae bacterium]
MRSYRVLLGQTRVSQKPPYYLELYDVTTGGWLSWCGYGSSCSANLSQAAATTHAFAAYLVSATTTTVPTSGYVSNSAKTFVTWGSSGYQVSVPNSVQCTTPTGHATITATANVDVTSTPYYIEIFDGSGNRIAVCPRNATCTASAPCNSFAYSAFISNNSTAFPPANTQASSNTAWTVVTSI